ncbi:MAG: class I SAM-dependent methyltransferase [Spirochaetaceae bacterium]|jgi:2-polyprenyl-3-methyl-5-hydroxy-6-metoxy-1,4-benzoquinol methylase|nr:class I SAM-dependent methyltransferase [Spirochaetaceae bacterium]
MSIKTWSTPPPDGADARDDSGGSPPCIICGGTKFSRSLVCEGFSFVKCCKCGLVRQNPPGDPASVLERYNKYDYLGYELQNEMRFFNLERVSLIDIGLPSIEKVLFGRGQNKFLDVGCATGALLNFMRGRGWQVAGVEISRAQAAFARNERGLDVRPLPLEDAGFAAGSFDVIHAAHLIEHLVRPDTFVRKAAELLNQDGLFIITTPNIDGFQARLFGHKWRSAIYDHLYLFSRSTLSTLLVKNGFYILKTVTWGGLADGCVPRRIKHFADRAAKRLNIGDVMIMLAVKTI